MHRTWPGALAEGGRRQQRQQRKQRKQQDKAAHGLSPEAAIGTLPGLAGLGNGAFPNEMSSEWG